MNIIEINESNIDTEHICCAIGNDKINKKRAETKKNWMKERFNDRLKFKRLDDRGKVFIEYIPIEKAWKPVIGSNYMLINCLWVSGKFKGQGYSTKLLNECINDTKSLNKDGIIYISSAKLKPFLTDKKFFIKKGFTVIDTAPPYFELLLLKFNNDAEDPKFAERTKTGECFNKKGLTFIFSNQCPYMEEYVMIMSKIAEKNGIKSTIKKITNSKEAKEFGSPFGTLGIYYEGKFLIHDLMPEKKFESFLVNLLKG